MTYNNFVKKYQPIAVKTNDNGFWNCVLETYGEDLEKVKKLAPTNGHVWTLVDGEGTLLYLMSGAHIINRLGYVVCQKPWTKKTIIKL